MGADVKQTGEQFGNSAKYLRWQDKAANQKFFAGEFQHVHQGSRRPAARDRHHQVRSRRSDDARRHAASSSSARSAPARSRVRSIAGCGAVARSAHRFEERCACDASPGSRDVEHARRPRHRVLRPVRRRSGPGRRFGGFVSKTFLADPLTMLQEGCDAADQARLPARHRHDDLARARRLRAGGRRRGAARHR